MGPLSHAPRDLRLLAGAVFLSATGDIVAMITLALVVHDLTGSGLAVSALFATTLVPVIALAGVAGLVADRFGSVRVLALASIAEASGTRPTDDAARRSGIRRRRRRKALLPQRGRRSHSRRRRPRWGSTPQTPSP